MCTCIHILGCVSVCVRRREAAKSSFEGMWGVGVGGGGGIQKTVLLSAVRNRYATIIR